MNRYFKIILSVVFLTLTTGCSLNDYSRETISVDDVIIFNDNENEIEVVENDYDNKISDMENSEWFEMYNSIIYSDTMKDKRVFYLAYIDQDDIPELITKDIYINIYISNGEDLGFGKYTYTIGYCDYSGKIVSFTDYGLDNIVIVTAYTYDKGSIIKQFDVEGELVYGAEGDYVIHGITFDQDSYNAIDDFIDIDNIVYTSYDNCYSEEEIIHVMKTGHDSSYTHRYEVIYDDVTWEEAQEICNEKGGYLAVVTSREELLRIKGLFSDRADLAVCYVGCKGTYKQDNRRWYLKDGNTIEIGGGKIDVFPYDNTCGVYCIEFDYKNETMEYGFLVYGKLRNDDSNYDVEMLMGPNDIVASNPDLSGKVGFICEYDE